MHNNDSLLANDMISEFEMNENTYNDEGKSGKDESTEDEPAENKAAEDEDVPKDPTDFSESICDHLD